MINTPIQEYMKASIPAFLSDLFFYQDHMLVGAINPGAKLIRFHILAYLCIIWHFVHNRLTNPFITTVIIMVVNSFSL